VKGDDIKHLDWKAYARNERLFIREYEEESNLRVYLLVDGSRSMAFGQNGLSKYELAGKMAAALAYTTVQQQDSVGLVLFDDRIRHQLPVRSSREHLRLLGNTLAEHTPQEKTDVSQTLHRVAEGIRRRALIILFSDLFDEIDRIHKALAHFRRRKHDVVVHHILDPAEISFPFHDVGNFQDMEGGDRLVTNPREVRQAYQEAVSDFLLSCQRMCAGLDVDYMLSTTDQDAIQRIRGHLVRRDRRGR
jgi:uncharacterized protein (DUF58 family)